MYRLASLAVITLALSSSAGCDAGTELDTELLAGSPSSFLAGVGGAGTYTGDGGCTITLSSGGSNTVAVQLRDGDRSATWNIDGNCSVFNTSASCNQRSDGGRYVASDRVYQDGRGLHSISDNSPGTPQCFDARK